MEKISHSFLKESFEKHSQFFGSRISNPEPTLLLENRLLGETLRESLRLKQDQVLIDAGCGTGDRLRMLLSDGAVPREAFRQIIGIDFAAGMTAQAKRQQLDGLPLYTEVHTLDLLENQDSISGDVVVCLWGVVNGMCDDADRILRNLSRMVTKDGLLALDVYTTLSLRFLKHLEEPVLAANPALVPFEDPQTLWYERADKTIAYLKLFSGAEINQMISACGLSLYRAYGYSRRANSVPVELETAGGRMDETGIERYSTLMLFMRRERGRNR